MSSDADAAERKRLKKLKKQKEREAAEAAAAAADDAEEEVEAEPAEKKKKKKKKDRAAAEEEAAGDDDDAAGGEEEPPRKKSKKIKEAAEDSDAEADEGEKKKKKKKNKENPDAAFVSLSKDKVNVGDKAAAASGQKIKKAFYKEHPEVAGMSHAVSGRSLPRCRRRARTNSFLPSRLSPSLNLLPNASAGRGGAPQEAPDLCRVEGRRGVQADHQVRARWLQ